MIETLFHFVLPAAIFFSSGFLFWLFYRKKPFIVLLVCLSHAILFCFIYTGLPLNEYFLFAALFSILLQLSLEDFIEQKVSIIPVILLFTNIILILLFQNHSLLTAFLSGIIGLTTLLLPYLLTRGKGMGTGDIIVFAVVCLLIQPQEIFIMLFLASISAIVFYLFLRLSKMWSKDQPLIPLIPFFHIILFFYYPFREYGKNVLGKIFDIF